MAVFQLGPLGRFAAIKATIKKPRVRFHNASNIDNNTNLL